MDEFVSTYTNRLDAKGRVSIPAPFRAVLARDGFEGLYCCPTLDRQAVDAGGNRLREQIRASLLLFEAFSEDHEYLSTTLIGESELLKIDQDGRVVLSDAIKAHAGIDDEVTFVGQGYKFQIWEPESFRSLPGRGQEPGARLAKAARSRPPRGERQFEGRAMTTGRDTIADGVAGGLARHVPVLIEEAMRFLAPAAGGTFIDGTFGAGGYTQGNPRSRRLGHRHRPRRRRDRSPGRR